MDLILVFLELISVEHQLSVKDMPFVFSFNPLCKEMTCHLFFLSIPMLIQRMALVYNSVTCGYPYHLLQG